MTVTLVVSQNARNIGHRMHFGFKTGLFELFSGNTYEHRPSPWDVQTQTRLFENFSEGCFVNVIIIDNRRLFPFFA